MTSPTTMLLPLILLLLPLSSPQSLPSDAVALLSFKSHADLDHRLLLTPLLPFDFCHWPGVSCTPDGRLLRLLLPSSSLRGTFPPNSLSLLPQLRVLNLRNNSLSGPLPADLHRLTNLKTLLLDHNLFSGHLPPSLFSLYKLRVLNLASNNLSGQIPAAVNRLDRLLSLRLDSNRLTGPIPPLNQTSLDVFNVSGNNLTGEVPKTLTLSRFRASSFSGNPNLCGGILNTPCNAHAAPFFNASQSSPSNSSSPASNSGPATSDSAVASPPQASGRRKRKVFALGLSLGTVFLLASLFCFIAAMRSNRRSGKVEEKTPPAAAAASGGGSVNSPLSERMSAGLEGRASNEMVSVKESKREREMKAVAKSGKLVFAVGETPAFTMEQLMRASAEMLGRGNVGTTYKAKLDNHLVVTVKRLDATRTAGVSEAALDRHMEVVGALRHPNLVPVRAYFQAKEERLIIYDYQPNGSVYNLVHGSRSTRTKPLHWTSCLKIAEDVAQGLGYIHHASRLIHGNLKATNVLLGPDFEACVTDHCLHPLKDPDLDDLDPASARYRAPESRHRAPTARSDIYAFGVLLVEMLSGRAPPEHPFIAPPDLPGWVRAMRDQDGGEEEEDGRLEMLVEVAGACSLVSPEQRPTMSQVLRMIQRIKNSVVESG